MKRVLLPLLLVALGVNPFAFGVNPIFADTDLSEQLEQVTQEIERSPADPSLLVRRADLHRRSGSWGLAIDDLHTARGMAGRTSRYDITMARLLEDMGQPKPAVHFVSNMLRAEPNSAPGLELRARLLHSLRRNEEAVRDYDARLALETRAEPDLWLARASLLSRMGHKKRALQGVEQGLARLRACLPLELRALELEEGLEQWKRALKRIERLAANSSRKETWLARRGDVFRLAGDLKAAAASYAQALQAIQSLSSDKRGTRMVQELESVLQKRLEELRWNTPSSS